jgi:hypothetical protein
LIPTVFNATLFATHIYGKTTVEYSKNTQVYADINSVIEAGGQSRSRVLWLPLKSTLQMGTPNIQHFSYTTIASDLFPLNTIRKDNRSYLYEPLRDNDFIQYLSFMGFNYVVIPDLQSEPDIKIQTDVLYQNFDMNKFISYSENNLQLHLIRDIDGYKIYSFHPPKIFPGVIDSAINSKYAPVGPIIINDNSKSLNVNYIFGQNTEVATAGNCNASQDLNFGPEDRIRLLNKSPDLQLAMYAKYNEVPCVFITFAKTSSTSAVLMDLSKYSGKNAELVMYSDTNTSEVSYKYITLSEKETGLIPLPCYEMVCKMALYLYGENVTASESMSMNAKFFETDSPILVDEGKNIIVDSIFIHSISYTPIEITPELKRADYLLFQYPYMSGYRLVADGKEIVPSENNHNMLLFKIAGLDIANIHNLYLTYLPEQQIQQSLKISRWSFAIQCIALLVVMICQLVLFFKKKYGFQS